MKAYIAGRLCNENQREFLEKIARICEEIGFKTFLPHRDVGLVKGISDVKRIFKKDILEGFKDVDIVIAVLDGLHVGAGTSWELGYAYAKNIPSIGLKTDEKIEDSLDSLSAILIASMEIVDSLENLKKRLMKFKNN